MILCFFAVEVLEIFFVGLVNVFAHLCSSVTIRVRPRFSDQVGHETMYASGRNNHFFTKSCHRQAYHNYEQSRQKLGTIF